MKGDLANNKANCTKNYQAEELTAEEIMVGKRDELMKTIKDVLIPGSTSNYGLQVVAVHGMGGIGKTMLAKRVYQDKSIKLRFDRRAWIVISPHYNKEQIFLSLLESLLRKGTEDDFLSIEDQINHDLKYEKYTKILKEKSHQEQPQNDSLNTEEMIYRHLKHMRYLIVMDDVWSVEVWNDVRWGCFPDDGNGSRVLLTTRLKNVAEHASLGNPENCYPMGFLDPEESWNLFQEKLFLKESSNQEFERIGKKLWRNVMDYLSQ